MPTFRRPPSSDPFAPRRSGALNSLGGTEPWATDNDFTAFERGADQLMAAPTQMAPAKPELSREDRERLVREQIPNALRGLAAAVTSPKLTAEERGDMARAAATLGVDFTPELDAAQLPPWEKESLRETARLLGGRGPVPFTFDAEQGNDGGAVMEKGMAHVQLDPTRFVRNGVVDLGALQAVIAHEGRHLYDQRMLGFTDRLDPTKTFTDMDQYRWTAQNAYRAEDAFNKVIGRANPDSAPLDVRVRDEEKSIRGKWPNIPDYRSGPKEKPWKF